MQALRARIRQLESDNASLTAAAEQASLLVEELAEDASKYRAGTHQTLLDELKQTSLRKDRRIQRLTEQLAAEREQNVLLQNRVTELEELKIISDRIEETLKDCVSVLQEKVQQFDSIPFEDGRHGMSLRRVLLPLLQDNLTKSILNTIESFFPGTVNLTSDFAVFRIALQARVVSVITELLRIESSQKPGPLSNVIDLFYRAGSVAQMCISWVLSDYATMTERANEVKQAIDQLEQRTVTLYIEVESFDATTQWTQEFTRMKTELLTVAVDSLCGLLPRELSSPTIAKSTEFSQNLITAYKQRAQVVAKQLDSLERERSHESQLSELKSKFEVGKTMLAQRNRELDELRVRNLIFEDRVKKATEDAERISKLQKELEVLQEKLRVAAQHSDPDVVKGSKTESTETKSDGYSKTVSRKKVETMSIPEKRTRANESSRLRKTIMQLQLADLQTVGVSTNICEPRYDEKIHTRKTLSVVLQSAREASSKARVLKLDPKSLQPKSRGATLSRKPLLQSLALSARMSKNTSINQFETRYADMRQVTVDTPSADIKSVVELFNSSLSF